MTDKDAPWETMRESNKTAEGEGVGYFHHYPSSSPSGE